MTVSVYESRVVLIGPVLSLQYADRHVSMAPASEVCAGATGDTKGRIATREVCLHALSFSPMQVHLNCGVLK